MGKTRQVCTSLCLWFLLLKRKPHSPSPLLLTGFRHQGSPLPRAERIPSFYGVRAAPSPFPLSGSLELKPFNPSSRISVLPLSGFVLPLLLNWTLVGLPSIQQSESTILGCARKVSADYRAEQGEWSPYSQDPNFLMAFGEGF